MKIEFAVDRYKKGPFRLYHLKSESYIEAGSVFYRKYNLNEYIVLNHLVDIVELMFMKHMCMYAIIQGNILVEKNNSTGAKQGGLSVPVPGKALRRLSQCIYVPSNL